eukprot:TRINITY_DN3682_c4_g1_i3.p1 TRINITY_DN3682_c4_g1~~TRINITY_DN3682_c4_g1_i3.p1  ORF type:complete len:365 (+),score=59.68 TRINITY_DN3682_c4_g1_i3:52-1146(+)
MLLAGIASLVCSATQPWLYSEYDQRGPSNWAAIPNGNGEARYPLCNGDADGAEQSPVNIRASEVSDALKRLEFRYTSTDAWHVENNQHTQKVAFDSSPGYLVDPALGDKKFNAVQLHLHAPSENAIGGGLYDMELHIVHEADTTQEGSTTKYSHAVLAIMFKAGSGHNPWLNNIFNKFQPLPITNAQLYGSASATFDYTTSSGTHPSINILDIIPSVDYFTFDGSLTTPPCTEGIKWYVVAQPATMSIGQLTEFQRVMEFSKELDIVSPGVTDPLVEYGNNRPLQPLNQRTVLKYQSNRHVTEQHLLPESADDDEDATNLGIVGTVTSCTALFLLVLYIIFGSRCIPEQPQQAESPAAEPTKDA